MKWIESSGGPLVVIPEVTLPNWSGTHDITGLSDYERACAVSGELGILRVGDTDVLILGDEPHRTAYVELDGYRFFVRWIAAQSEERFIEVVGESLERPGEEPRVRMSVRDESLLLIDSSEAGDDARRSALVVRVPLANYQVDTVHVRTVDVHAVLHRLVRED